MNKFQAIVQIMVILCKDAHLKPGSTVYKVVREKVSQRIDIWGPDAALLNVIDRKPQILHQIKMLKRWQERGKLLLAIEF